MPIQGDSPLPPNVYVSIHPDFPFQPLFLVPSFTDTYDTLDIRDIEIHINFRRWYPHISTGLGLSFPISTHKFYSIELCFANGIYESLELKTFMLARFDSILSISILPTVVLFHELTHIAERKKRGDAFANFNGEEKVVVEKEKEFVQAVLREEKSHFLELLQKK